VSARTNRQARLAGLREQRREAMQLLRRHWRRLEPAGRAFMLCHRARLWTFHPAAMAVERSAEARLTKLRAPR
jgi:hypothetical protein